MTSYFIIIRTKVRKTVVVVVVVVVVTIKAVVGINREPMYAIMPL